MSAIWTLGIDVGTTTVSVAAWEPRTRRVLATVTRAHGAAGGGDGATQDPGRILGAVREALAELGRSVGEGARALACTGQMHGVVLLDAAREPVTPLVTWQDIRTADHAARADAELERLAPGGWRARGCRLHPGYGAVTLAWLALEGTVPSRAVTACTVADWVASRLGGGGQVATDPSQAASWGILDLASGRWDLDAAAVVGVPRGLLPRIRPTGALLGRADLGELGRDVAVVSGLGDNQASVYAALTVLEGSPGYIVNVGTGCQLSYPLPQGAARAPLTDGLEERPYLEDSILRVAAGLNGGSAYALLAEFLVGCGALGSASELFRRMDGWAAAVRPGCDGLSCDPAFRGERGQPGLAGSLRGLTPATFTPGHLCRAVLEGMARSLGGLADRAACRGRPVVGSGNAVRTSEVFRGILARELCAPMHLSPHVEEAAVGAAMVAAARI